MKLSEQTIQRQSVIATSSPLPTIQILWVIFAFGGLMSLGWLDNARGPIYPLILSSLDITHTQGSLFFAMSSMTAVVANFMVPFFVRILNPQKLLFIGVLNLAVFPVALSFTKSFPMLLISAVLFGLSLGVVGVTQNIVVEQNVRPHKKRFYLSLLHSIYGLSALLAPIFIGLILKSGAEWRNSFLYSLYIIVPVLGVGLLCFFYKPNLQLQTAAVAPVEQKVKLNKKLLFFWGLLLAFYVSSELFFATRLVVIFKELFLYSLQDANDQLTLFFLGLFIGRLGVSFVPVLWTGRLILGFSFLLSAIWILFCFFVAPSLIWFVGFLMSPIFPLAMDEISNQTGKNFTAYSSVIIALSSIGVVIMHVLVGYIFEYFGLRAGLFLPLILCTLSLVLTIYFWPVSEPEQFS